MSATCAVSMAIWNHTYSRRQLFVNKQNVFDWRRSSFDQKFVISLFSEAIATTASTDSICVTGPAYFKDVSMSDIDVSDWAHLRSVRRYDMLVPVFCQGQLQPQLCGTRSNTALEIRKLGTFSDGFSKNFCPSADQCQTVPDNRIPCALNFHGLNSFIFMNYF